MCVCAYVCANKKSKSKQWLNSDKILNILMVTISGACDGEYPLEIQR